MIFPTVHLNGTSGDDLLSQTTDAMLALSTALDALKIMGPHGRNYYVQGPRVIDAAMDEHIARIEKLEAVQADLVAISQSIYAQMTPPRTAPKTTIRAEWFADGTPATCTCGRSPDCDHVQHAQAYAKVSGSVGAVWSEIG